MSIEIEGIIEQKAELICEKIDDMRSSVYCHEFSLAAIKARDIATYLEELNIKANAAADAV